MSVIKRGKNFLSVPKRFDLEVSRHPDNYIKFLFLIAPLATKEQALKKGLTEEYKI